MIVNDADTLAEVTAAFNLYEKALMTNDLATLDGLFWDSVHTLRYGVGENLYGIAAIREFRKNRPGGSPPRVLRNTVITTYGKDYATANTEFIRQPSPSPDPVSASTAAPLGRQSQTWVRSPLGWRIVAAHVSVIDEAPGQAT